MDLSRLASKQKRYRDLGLFALAEVTDPTIRQELQTTLIKYRDALAQCWAKQYVSSEDVTAIDSIERDLDSLSSTARLRTASS